MLTGLRVWLGWVALPLLLGCLPVWPAPRLVSRALHPKIGVHTRLTGEVEPAKVARTLDMVADMGASWDVEYFPWVFLQPHPDVYHWDHADMVVNAAVARGLTLVARVDLVPDWARPAQSTERELDPADYAAFARFLATFARRYEGKISYLVVWNEPNLSFEWGYRPPDPVAYAALLKTVYPAVKAANPMMQIVSAGLAETLATGGIALNDLAYLDRMYAAGAAPYFDILGAHAYGDVQPADQPPAAGRLNFQRVVLEHEVMARHGDGGKPVLITEAGWNDAPRWTHAVSPAARVRYTVDAYRLAAGWPWLLALCMWQFRLPDLAHTAQDYFSFVTPDFTPRAVYEAVQAYAHGP